MSDERLTRATCPPDYEFRIIPLTFNRARIIIESDRHMHRLEGW